AAWARLMIEVSAAKAKPSERSGAYCAATRNVATVASIAENPAQKFRIAADVSLDSRRNDAVVTVPHAMLRLSRVLEGRRSRYLSYNTPPTIQPAEEIDPRMPM